MPDQDRDEHLNSTTMWCRDLQLPAMARQVEPKAAIRLRRALIMIAVAAVVFGGTRAIDEHSTPGSGFSTIATVGAEPTGPPGPTGGMTDGGGSQFQPPGQAPSMPDYQGGNNLPPLDQNSGISIYNSGAPQAGQQAGGQQGGQQPQQGWDQPAHGTQPPNYSTAPGYTQGPGKPNPDYQAPQQNSPQQGQQPSQAPTQTQQPEQPEQQQEDSSQQDQGDQQRQQRCQAMSQQIDQTTQTAGQVIDVAQKVGDAAEIVLPKGGGGSLGPDGEVSPGRVPVQPLECGDCSTDRQPQNPLCKFVPNPAAQQVCNDYIDDWMENFEEKCEIGKPNCKGKVAICLPRDMVNPSEFTKKGLQDYINGGNDLIKRNDKLGGMVIKRSTKGMQGRKDADKARAILRYGAEAFKDKAPGHIPDLTWMGTEDDDRDVIPMDKSLNWSIGGQSNRFKENFQATEFAEGAWQNVPWSKTTQCLANGVVTGA